MSGGSGFGPDYQNARSRLYRTEYAAVTLAVLLIHTVQWARRI